MPTELLPLFPLGVVLLPRTHLPLHIFEERYKEMIGECVRNRSEFGIVLAAEKGIVATGCTAVVEKITQQYDDGRMDIVVVGVRRFEIESLDTGRAYLRGAVRFFNDEESEPVPAELKARALQAYRLLTEADTDEPPPPPELDDPQLSFQLAQAVPDPEFRQILLTMRSERERLRRLIEFAPIQVARRRYSAHVKAVAPWNGHGPNLARS